jgi:hypothetical protein
VSLPVTEKKLKKIVNKATEKETQFMTDCVDSKFIGPASTPVNLKCADEYVTPRSFEGVHGRFEGMYWIKDILAL